MNPERTRVQRGQPFQKADTIAVGDVVWFVSVDINHAKSRLEGPYFVVECVHKGTMSEHWKLFSTHESCHHAANIRDLWVPIIDTIKPPRGHNA